MSLSGYRDLLTILGSDREKFNAPGFDIPDVVRMSGRETWPGEISGGDFVVFEKRNIHEFRVEGSTPGGLVLFSFSFHRNHIISCRIGAYWGTANYTSLVTIPYIVMCERSFEWGETATILTVKEVIFGTPSPYATIRAYGAPWSFLRKRI